MSEARNKTIGCLNEDNCTSVNLSIEIFPADTKPVVTETDEGEDENQPKLLPRLELPHNQNTESRVKTIENLFCQNCTGFMLLIATLMEKNKTCSNGEN